MTACLKGLRVWVLRCTFVALATPLSGVLAQQIWFSPPDNLPRGGGVANDDFPGLWTSPDEWSVTSSHMAVFALSPLYAAVGPEDELKRMGAFLQKRKIPLNIGMQALPVDDCGRGVEGMTKAGTPKAIARRLKALGLQVDSFSFDEPLHFGHVYRGAAACSYSIKEVASRLASTVHDLREIYPEAKIVDFEPPGDLPLVQWTETLREWLAEYKNATRTKLDALAMDFYLRKPWRDTAGATAQILREQGVQVGMFLDAPGGPTVTDESWIAEAKSNAQQIQAANLQLDFVIFATWMHHPKRILPESDPGTFSSFSKWYIEKIHQPPH